MYLCLPSMRESVSSSLHRIQSAQVQLEHVQQSKELVLRAQDVTGLCMRLASQMDVVLECDVMHAMQDTQALHQHAGHVVAAAATLQELEELVYAPPDEDEVSRELRTECAQLEFVGPHLTWLPDAAQILQEQIENLLLCGLRHLSPMLLGMALQAAEHRGTLPEVVRNLLDDLSDVLLERIRAALDLYAIGKTLGETQPPLLPPRTLSAIYHHQPDASASHPHATEQIQCWTSAIWERIHSLVVDEMAPIFTKVHMLEHVLHLKHEPTSGTTFLEVVSKVRGYGLHQNLQCAPTKLLWKSFSHNFGMLVNECVHESDFWRFVLVYSYPRLRQIFQELFSRISLLTDRTSANIAQVTVPEPVVEMLAHQEKTYLGTVSHNLTEARQAIRAAFATSGNAAKGLLQARGFIATIVTELKACASDDRLEEKVIQMVSHALETLIQQVPSLVYKEENAYSLQGTQSSGQQSHNTAMASTLVVLRKGLSSIRKMDSPHLKKIGGEWEQQFSQVLRSQMLTPLAISVKREIATVLSRTHRFKLDKPQIAVSADSAESDTSAYMLELCARLAFLRTHILSQYHSTAELEELVLDLARYAMQTFMLHVSLIRLHQEAEKLQMVSDMTTLELSLLHLLTCIRRVSGENALSLDDCGPIFHAVRHFRTVLFQPTDKLVNPAAVNEKMEMPDIIWIQHLFTRSTSYPLPNELRRLGKSAYVEWLLGTRASSQQLCSDEAKASVLADVHKWLSTQATVNDSADKDTLRCLQAWDKYLKAETQ